MSQLLSSMPQNTTRKPPLPMFNLHRDPEVVQSNPDRMAHNTPRSRICTTPQSSVTPGYRNVTPRSDRTTRIRTCLAVNPTKAPRARYSRKQVLRLENRRLDSTRVMSPAVRGDVISENWSHDSSKIKSGVSDARFKSIGSHHDSARKSCTSLQSCKTKLNALVSQSVDSDTSLRKSITQKCHESANMGTSADSGHEDNCVFSSSSSLSSDYMCSTSDSNTKSCGRRRGPKKLLKKGRSQMSVHESPLLHRFLQDVEDSFSQRLSVNDLPSFDEHNARIGFSPSKYMINKDHGCNHSFEESLKRLPDLDLTEDRELLNEDISIDNTDSSVSQFNSWNIRHVNIGLDLQKYMIQNRMGNHRVVSAADISVQQGKAHSRNNRKYCYRQEFTQRRCLTGKSLECRQSSESDESFLDSSISADELSITRTENNSYDMTSSSIFYQSSGFFESLDNRNPFTQCHLEDSHSQITSVVRCSYESDTTSAVSVPLASDKVTRCNGHLAVTKSDISIQSDKSEYLTEPMNKLPVTQIMTKQKKSSLKNRLKHFGRKLRAASLTPKKNLQTLAVL